MANIKILFNGTENSETQEHKLECFANSNNEIYIEIDSGCNEVPDFICLDKSTAIKFSKTLRTEINKIKE